MAATTQIAARRSTFSTFEILSILLEDGEIRLRKRVLSTDYADYTNSGRDGLLNLRHLRMFSRSQPAPDRVDHYDNSGKHDDSGETCIDEALKRTLGFLRQRPED